MSDSFPEIYQAITENYGERCDEYAEGCACCELWKEFDRIAALEAERDEKEQITRDLAMLVRRLCAIGINSYELIEQANDYLRRKNLQGSPLR